MRLGLLVVALWPTTPAIAAPIPASQLIIRQSSPNLSWRWRAPPELAEQPALLTVMRAEAVKTAAKDRAAAARDAASAAKAGFPFRRHETLTSWTLAADAPRLLALSGETYANTGGAHGNTGYAVKIWDKTTKRALTIDQLFTDWPRARKLLEPVYCKALAQEQAQRRGGLAGGTFDTCPRLAEQPVVPWGALSNRAQQFRVLLGPYAAGSYAEGSYLITAPWPDAVKPLTRAAYRRDLFGDGE